MRVTMGMVMRQYTKGLNNSLSELNKASNREITLRRYDTVSEDPLSASKAFRLRREYLSNQSYQSETDDAADQMNLAHSIILSINGKLTQANSGECLGAITGSKNSTDRANYAKTIRGLQETILTSLNTKYGDKYIFGGSDSAHPPFTLGANGNLLYRGVDVDTGKIEAGSTLSYNGAQITLGDSQFNGYKIQVTTADGAAPSVSADTATKTITVNLATGAKNSDVLSALKANPSLTSTDGSVTFDLSKVAISGDLNCPVDTGVQSKTATDTIGLDGLKKLASEEVLVDIGLGLSLKTSIGADGNTLNDQSVFNTAIPGISLMDFGTENGISNNIYNLMGQIADQLEEKNGAVFSMDTIQPYLNKLTKQQDFLVNKMTQVDTNYSFLKTTATNLQAIGDSVEEKMDKTEYVDFETAFLDWSMQQYQYNAALKIGNQILQPTFLDFMR